MPTIGATPVTGKIDTPMAAGVIVLGALVVLIFGNRIVNVIK
jgi:hypothetical protein